MDAHYSDNCSHILKNIDSFLGTFNICLQEQRVGHVEAEKRDQKPFAASHGSALAIRVRVALDGYFHTLQTQGLQPAFKRGLRRLE